MEKDNKSADKQSFIAAARREQMVEAAITTLDEIGYVKKVLSNITTHG